MQTAGVVNPSQELFLFLVNLDVHSRKKSLKAVVT